jgi:hypothetical protein
MNMEEISLQLMLTMVSKLLIQNSFKTLTIAT